MISRSALYAAGVVAVLAAPTSAQEKPPVEPVSVRALVADGKHNAFTAMVDWKDAYWLAFRSGASHGYGEAEVVVLRSGDGESWSEARRVNAWVDDRDPQFLATAERLFLYVPALEGSKLKSFVTYTDDGKAWSEPREVYRPQFIFWKPVAHGERYWATAHVKAEGKDGGSVREVHLIASDDGVQWEKVSTIRAGNWESETTIHFEPDGRITAFLRQKYSTPGFIREAAPPYASWTERPAGVHLSGHCVTKFDGVTYLFSRTMEGGKTGTMIYTWSEGKLHLYCRLPSGGDCSYPAAVQVGDEMLVSYYSSHEGSTNVYLARVPLKPK